MHIKGKVYDITKENINKLIDELEQTQDKVLIIDKNALDEMTKEIEELGLTELTIENYEGE
jgi:gamma-glutamylcyclotransferase (GGCT)/AIG2-like uncharacterized protein YtfP